MLKDAEVEKRDISQANNQIVLSIIIVAFWP